MEVSLLDVQGLPPGCLVSIRSGTTRCQAPADPDKLRLFFPKGAKDPFKVDLLAPLGSAEIQYQPDVNAYPIQVPVNGAIGSITLAVRQMEKPSKPDLNAISAMEYTKDDKGRPATPSTASRRHRLALQARTYLDEHQLLMFVQSLLQGLIRDRPVDPWEYINSASLEAKKIGVSEPYKPGSTPREKQEGFSPPPRDSIPSYLQYLAPSGMTWAECLAPSRPVVSEEGMLTGPWLEAIRAAVTFEHETPAWSSLDEFAGAEIGPAGMVMDYLERCGYGEFADAMFKAEREARAPYQALEALHEATPVVTRPTSAQPSLVVQTQAQQSPPKYFNQRASVGTWCAPRLPQRPTPAATCAPRVQSKAPTAAEIDGLRLKLRGALAQASSDGRLCGMLDDFAKASTSQLQVRARESLDKAQEDGSLTELVSQMRAMEDVRRKAVGEFRKASADGSLQLKMQEVVSDMTMDIKDVQKKARSALLEASKNGKLAKAFAEQQRQNEKQAAASQPLSPELANAREEMRMKLAKAAKDGTFGQALSELRPKPKVTDSLPWFPLPFNYDLHRPSTSQTPAKAPSPVKPSSSGEGDEINTIRAQARKALMEASTDGRFLNALDSTKQVKIPSDVQELRSNAARLLLKAGEDGSLLTALQDVRKEEPPPVVDEAAEMRKMAQEMLLQAGGDPRFLAALQEAFGAAGFEMTLRPKPTGASAPSSSSAAAAPPTEENLDMDQLRSRVSGRLVEASTNGSFLNALENASNEAAAEAELQRLQNKATDKVRQTGKASADIETIRLDAQQLLLKANKTGDLRQALKRISSKEVFAPVHGARCGDEVRRTADPSKRGSVLRRTTTEVLLQMEDGTEAWHGAEELEQVLTPALDVQEGQEVIESQTGKRGRTKSRNGAEVLVLHDDGTEDWYKIDAVGRAKSNVKVANYDDEALAKEEARAALTAAFLSDDPEEELDLAKTNIRAALCAALLGERCEDPVSARLSENDSQWCKSAREVMSDGSGEQELEVAKESACAALMSALGEFDEDTKESAREVLSDGSGEQELEVAKESAREALTAALFGIEDAKECAREALAAAFLGDEAPENNEEELAKEAARGALMAALRGDSLLNKAEALSEAAPAKPCPLEAPFCEYYNKHFFVGAPRATVEGLARRLFAKPQETKDEPPPESEKAVETQALAAASFAELEDKIRVRNERFKLENECLRAENRRLQDLLKQQSPDKATQ